MPLQGIRPGKRRPAPLARRRDAQVYGQDVPHEAFQFELLGTSHPLTLERQFSAGRAEVVCSLEVLGDGVLEAAHVA